MDRAGFVMGRSSADGCQDLLERATVMLTLHAGRPGIELSMGTGFFVAPGVVVTCAHVLGSVAESPPGRIEGRIVALGLELELKSDPARCFRDSATGLDLAILEVTAPVGLRGAGPVLLSPELSALDSLWTYGHPAGSFRPGQKATFVYQGDSRRTTDQAEAIFLPRGYGVPVTAGYSGGPVVNRRTGAVCGMLVTSDQAGSAHMISAADILVRCPEAGAISRSVAAHRTWLETLTDEQLAANEWRYAGPRLRAYLAAACAAANEHPYPGVLPGRRPPLAQVYVRQSARMVPSQSSDPWDKVPEAGRCGSERDGLPAGAILTAEGNSMLIGGPGAGKSSLLRVSLVELAERWLSGDGENLAGVPVRVTAVDLAELAPLAEQLAAAVKADLGGRQLVGLDTEFFARPPVVGVPWLVLVDGLDEILSPEHRLRVIEVLGTHQRQGKYRFILASRPLTERAMVDLGEAGLRERFELLPFDGEDLLDFARAWCAAFGLTDPEGSAADFVDQIDSAQLHEEARNPLMATLLCQLFANDPSTPLPSGRYRLYEAFVELLRSHQFSSAAGGVFSQASAALRPYGADTVVELILTRIHDALAHIALARFSDDPVSALEVVAQRSRDLRPTAMNETAWKELLREALRRSGLMTEHSEDFLFLHETLVEFLAARHIATHEPWRRRLRLCLALGRLPRWLPGYRTAAAQELIWLEWTASTQVSSLDRFLIEACLESPSDRRLLNWMLRRLATSRDVAGCTVLVLLILDGILIPAPVRRALHKQLARSAMDDTRESIQRVAAARALELLDPRGTEYLASLAAELTQSRLFDPGDLRGLALEALMEGDPARLAAALESLDAEAEDPALDSFRRLGAADALDQLGDSRGGDHLARMATVSDVHPLGRAWAARRLAAQRDPRYSDCLAAIATDGSAGGFHRLQAAYALTRMEEPRGRELLTAIAADPLIKGSYRVWVARQLLDQGSKAAVEQLTVISKDRACGRRARAEARHALGRTVPSTAAPTDFCDDLEERQGIVALETKLDRDEAHSEIAQPTAGGEAFHPSVLSSGDNHKDSGSTGPTVTPVAAAKPTAMSSGRHFIKGLSKRMSKAPVLVERQVRRRVTRAAPFGGIGIGFALVFDIRIGITVAVFGIICDGIRRARINSSVVAWQKSSAAERRTEKQLKALAKNGYQILHARAVPTDDDGVSDGKIDHLVVGPSGVYAIDSEKWDKRLPVRTLSHRKLFHGPFNKKDRLDEARWEADQASRMITAQVGFDVPVQPSVAIYGPSIPWKVMRVRDVDVYSGNRARSYLRRRPKVLTETDVQRIFTAAEKALPPRHVNAPDSETVRQSDLLKDPGALGKLDTDKD